MAATVGRLSQRPGGQKYRDDGYESMRMADIDRLRRENFRLRREIAHLQRKNGQLAHRWRKLRAAIDSGDYVPLSEYEELADVAGIVTTRYHYAYHAIRRGPKKKNSDAVEKADFVWREYQAALARGEDEMPARQTANKVAGRKWGGKKSYGGGHYSERSVRNIINGG